MKLSEIEEQLPWGLHDAYLERLELDWLRKVLVMDVRLMMNDRQDMDQRAQIKVTGLVYCTIEPPIIDPTKGYEAMPEGGLWIVSEEGASNKATNLPETPDGCFMHHLLVSNWNFRAINICGKDASLSWIELEPVSARSNTRALFPGDEIPDPGKH